MYSGADPIPNHMDATLLAQVPSSVHQPRADGSAHDNLLGKRHTILNHHTFHSAIKHVNDSPSPFKKQKMATHVNARHMALHFPHSSHQWCTPLAPVQSFTNQSLPLKESQAGAERKQSKSPLEINGMNNAIISTSSEINVSSNENDTVDADVQLINDLVFGQNSSAVFHANVPTSSNNNTFAHTFDRLVLVDDGVSNEAQSTSHTKQRQHSEPCNVSSQEASPTSSTFHSIHGINIGVTNSHTLTNHTHTSEIAQATFLRRVQNWTNAIKHICNDRESQCLYLDLFGEKPTFTANDPDLLKLLEKIDQQKNQITFQEERFTNLAEEIFKVLKTCQSPADNKIIKLATRILDSFYQRFQKQYF